MDYFYISRGPRMRFSIFRKKCAAKPYEVSSITAILSRVLVKKMHNIEYE